MNRKDNKAMAVCKRLLSLLADALPHMLMILMGMLLTFCIIDRVNSAMGFIDNAMTKGIMMAASVISFVVSGMMIYYRRKYK